MLKKAIMKGLIVLAAGCMLMTACGQDESAKTQGFTQSLEEEQSEADSALEIFEQVSEALDNAIEKRDERDGL